MRIKMQNRYEPKKIVQIKAKDKKNSPESFFPFVENNDTLSDLNENDRLDQETVMEDILIIAEQYSKQPVPAIQTGEEGDALYQLGEKYRLGLEAFPINLTEAKNNYAKAALLGHKPTLNRLAQLGEQEYNLNNFYEAIGYLILLEQNISFVSCAQLGISYFHTGQFKAAEPHLQKAMNSASFHVLQNQANYYYSLYLQNRKSPGDESEAWQILEKLAPTFSDAYDRMGFCYEHGWGGKRINLEKAVEFYNEAAKRNNLNGIYHLAECYKYGSGTEKNKPLANQYYDYVAEKNHYLTLGQRAEKEDPVQAFQYYALAAKTGNPNAQFKLAICYDLGLHREQNLDEAKKNYALAAAQGHSTAIKNLGILYFYFEENHEPGMKYLRSFLKYNPDDQEANRYLGFYYYQIKDYIHAIYYLENVINRLYDFKTLHILTKCYKITNSESYQKCLQDLHEINKTEDQKYALAQSYLNGEIAEKNLESLETAKSILAELMENKSAKYQLAIIAISEKNTKVALEYLKEAADLGHTEAKFELGTYFYQHKSYESAHRYFKALAEDNDSRGNYHLGLCFYYGHGVIKDEGKALNLFKIAADVGDLYARYFLGKYCLMQEQYAPLAPLHFKMIIENQENLRQNPRIYMKASLSMGKCYLHGLGGLNKDLSESLKYFQLADQDSPETNYLMGRIFEDLSEQDKAFQYYLKTLSTNYAPGLYRLGLCYKYGKPQNPQNDNNAFYSFKKAVWKCKNAPADAYYQLAWYLEKGFETADIPKKQIIELYKAAAAKNHCNALFRLALCHEKGELGIEIDLEQAGFYYSAAEKYGHKEAQSAKDKLFAAAEKDDSDPSFFLAKCYETHRNKEQAWFYYSEAAKHGHKEAQDIVNNISRWLLTTAKDKESEHEALYLSGWCCENGLFAQDINLDNAIEHYKNAVHNYGHEMAHLGLVRCYFEQKKFADANIWLSIAIINEVPGAQAMLDAYYTSEVDQSKIQSEQTSKKRNRYSHFQTTSPENSEGRGEQIDDLETDLNGRPSKRQKPLSM
jgi:TPR repeat protein